MRRVSYLVIPKHGRIPETHRKISKIHIQEPQPLKFSQAKAQESTSQNILGDSCLEPG